jgi:hypothetical protein
MTVETDVLEPLIGRWEIPIGDGEPGETTFAWALGRRFVEQRSSVPVEGAPDGLIIIAPAADGDGFTQHYFDSRGVIRLYAMTFDGRELVLERHEPDFSALPFHQRFEGTLSADGSRLEGRWLTSPDGEAWELDFRLTYVRA